jgi:transcriptional/translational regulatory protein YebC/TACO1
MGAQWKQKGREQGADAKGKLFTKLAKEIMVAARSGADPNTNSRLRLAVEAAKRASMTRETLERAIKKGAGLLEGQAQHETVVYDNMRLLFKKGQLGASGSVSWDFNRVGAVEATPPAAGEDAEEAAIEAGAQEVELAEEGLYRFITEPTDLDVVSKALGARGWGVTAASQIWVAKNPVQLEGEARAEVEAFLAALDEDDDVQHLYVGLA